MSILMDIAPMTAGEIFLLQLRENFPLVIIGVLAVAIVAAILIIKAVKNKK